MTHRTPRAAHPCGASNGPRFAARDGGRCAPGNLVAMAEPFVALPALLAALDATCEARSCTVDAVAADIDAMADWTMPVTGTLLNAMVAGTFVPSSQLAQAVATVVGVDARELFEVHPDVGRLMAGKRLIDDEIGVRAATRAAGRVE